MKKIILMSAAVLTAAFAFASRTSVTKPAGEKSSVSVMHAGQDLVRVFYTSADASRVTIAIRNKQGETVFAERIKSSEGFMRPYNFKDLPEGQYTINVTDANGKQVKTVDYEFRREPANARNVTISEVKNASGKYLISGYAVNAEKITVKVFDESGNVLHEKSIDADGNFGELYNLQGISGKFTIAVSDSQGALAELSK